MGNLNGGRVIGSSCSYSLDRIRIIAVSRQAGTIVESYLPHRFRRLTAGHLPPILRPATFMEPIAPLNEASLLHIGFLRT